MLVFSQYDLQVDVKMSLAFLLMTSFLDPRLSFANYVNNCMAIGADCDLLETVQGLLINRNQDQLSEYLAAPMY